MTREEAIQELQNCKGLIQQDGQDYLDERDIPLLDMAIEALSAEHKHCWDCKHYEPKYNVCHAPEVVKQVTSKLKKPCDSLLTEESNGSKEQKSKLEHDRERKNKTKYPATYNINTKCGGCVHLDELGRCLNFMLAKDDRSCWRGSWENNNGELAEQTDNKLPGYDEIMEKLDELTLKGGDHE